MNKLVVIVVALVFCGLAVIGGVVYATQSPVAKACSKLEQQCGEDVITASECKASLDGASEHEINEVTRCVEPSGSCVESVGCLSGSALRDLGRGLLRGIAGAR